MFVLGLCQVYVRFMPGLCRVYHVEFMLKFMSNIRDSAGLIRRPTRGCIESA